MVLIEVLVDAVRLGQGAGIRGIGTYARNLMDGLSALPDVHVKALAVKSTPLPVGVHRVPVFRVMPPRPAHYEHKALLPLDIARVRADVFLGPAYDPPRWSSKPWVFALHDVTPLEHPAAIAGRAQWLRYAPRLRAADAVVMGSRWSAERAIDRLGLSPERVHVIPYGVEDRFREGDPEPDTLRPYLLFMSAWGAWKGYSEALDVIARIRAAGYPHRLAFLGGIGEPEKKWLYEEAARRGCADRIDVLGFVDDHLPVLRRASALIVTSRMEGFGFPAVEAMAAGVPVVSFDNSALHEVVGSGGILVPDGDTDAMAEAVRPLIDDPASWAKQSECGRVRARVFDWQACAQQHAEVFRTVAR